MTGRMRTALLLTIAGMMGVVVGALAAGDGDKANDEQKIVVDAVKKAFPDAQIGKVERERETVSVTLYEVAISQGGKRAEIIVTPDGTVAEIVHKLHKGDQVPDKVAATAKMLATKGKITEVERITLRAVPRFQPLDKERTVYEVEMIHNGREVEVRIDEEGKILGSHRDADDDDQDGDDDDDDDDNGNDDDD